MPTLIAPSSAVITTEEIENLKNSSVFGWLSNNDTRMLTPIFHLESDETQAIVTEMLENRISQQIGTEILGPTQIRLADRLVLADFALRNTRRLLPVRTMLLWISLPHEIDWTMQLYYAAWHSYMTSHSLTQWLAWQNESLLPVTALRRVRESLFQDAAGVLTRLEVVETLKHLDQLSAEW